MAGYNEDGTPRLRYDEGGNVVGYSGMNSGVTAPTDYTNAIAKQNFGNDMLILGQGWDTPNWADWRYISGGTGQRYPTAADYWKDVYGGGSVKTMENPYNDNSFVTYFDPEGRSPDTSKYISFNGPDSMLGNLVLAGILGTAGAGLTGMLPGTESVFGGAGAGAGGAEAAWGVNPASTGGADALSLAGEAPWWEAGMPSTAQTLGGVSGALDAALPLSAASAGGLAAAAGTGAASSLGGNLATSQAIDGSMQTIYDAAASAGVPGYDAALVSGVANTAATANTASALSRVWDQINGKGEASFDDWAKVLGNAAVGIGGVVSANQQSGAYNDLADKYFGLGAPYRDRLKASYDPGFDLTVADPAFKNALDTSAQTAARAWSARAGNPAENPGVQSEIQNYVLNSSYLPQLNTYRSQLGNFGLLGTDLSGAASSKGILAQGGGWEAVGNSIGNLTNPQPNISGILSKIIQQSQGGSSNNQFKLNQGFSL